MDRIIRHEFKRFPKSFWTLIGASFIDRLGEALLFPFFALYITGRFDVGLRQVGILFAIFAAAHSLGSMTGGVLTDKWGRRRIIIVGLLTSGLASLALGLADSLHFFYELSFLAGFSGSLAGPAQQAMVADLLPAEKQPEGYGIQRIQLNLAVAIGPLLGGLLAGHSYLFLFVADAISSLVTAVIVYLVLMESRPEAARVRSSRSGRLSLGGYGPVFANGAYMLFLLISMLLLFVYMQTMTTLPVYLQEFHNVSPQGYGYLLSLNAAMVVLLQLWVTRRVTRYAPMVVMAVGGLLTGLGVGLFGLASDYTLFIAAVVIFTSGEIIIAPIGQSLVARFAPEEMRGRYLALFELCGTIPTAVGPYLAGYAMETFSPAWVWLAAIPLGIVVAAGYLGLDLFWNRREEGRLVGNEV